MARINADAMLRAMDMGDEAWLELDAAAKAVRIRQLEALAEQLTAWSAKELNSAAVLSNQRGTIMRFKNYAVVRKAFLGETHASLVDAESVPNMFRIAWGPPVPGLPELTNR